MRARSKTIALYSVLVLALAAAGTLAYTAAFPRESAPQTNTRTVTAQRASVSQTVSATGHLEPATSTDVSFGTGGTITEVDVKEGDHVDAGQVLAKVDPSEAQTDLQVAQLNYTAAVNKYDQAATAATSTTTVPANGSGGA